MIVALAVVAALVSAAAGFVFGRRRHFNPATLTGAACGICGSPKCRACDRGLVFGHVEGTPYCSAACSEKGPRVKTWAEMIGALDAEK